MRTYEKAVKCLNQLQTNYSVIQELHYNRLKGKSLRDPDLIPEMIEYIRRIGYTPEDLNALNPIHITGTKGKGSVCAFVQSILLQYDDGRSRTGLYTSPHLKSVRERIMIDGHPLSEEKFAKYFFDVYRSLDETSSDPKLFPRLIEGKKPMYFRFLTLVSFHAFMQEKVNNAIYEVGIGGEYDSTNVFVKPSACAVTSLGLDHTALLGDTVAEIAWNKAGIFKQGVPAYTIDDQPSDALQVLKDRAEEKKVSRFRIVSVHKDVKGCKLGLMGKFQEKNATLACYLAGERLGIPINDAADLPEKFLTGLKTASWPGRCQILQKDKAKWFIDGAHTAESLDVSAEWLASVIDKSAPISLVFNQQKRGNVEELLKRLHKKLDSLGVTVTKAYFTTNKSFESGFPEDMISHNVSRESVDQLLIQKRLAQVWQNLSPQTEVHVCSNLESVVAQAEGQIFATGSILMVGALLVVID